MTRTQLRRHGFGAAAVALLALDALVRLIADGPYVGATFLLLAACGLVLLPFVPVELERPSVLVAVVPALAVGSYSVLLTTVSIASVRLTETSIRAAVIALVAALAAIGALVPRSPSRERRPCWSPRREAVAAALLAGVFAFALASSWDIAYPFQARGTDWGHYLLYADEVAAQEHLLIDDPLAGEDGRVFADPPAVGAVYGSFLVLDGVSSWSLTAGIVVLSALTVLSVYAAVATLWGAGAGLAAAAAYGVAPIRLDPMYWHGLGTTLALLFVPIVLLAISLLFRRGGDRRTTVLLAVGLASVAAAHATSAFVVVVLVVLAPVVDLARRLAAGRGIALALRSWWRVGLLRPVVTAAVLAIVLGAGVVAHLLLQASALGRPVSYRFLGTDWLDRAAIEGYYSWQFLGVIAVALGLVASSRRLRTDPALLAAATLALACVVVSQLWRVHVPYEYRRTVYYLAVAMVVVVGVAFLRARPRALWVGAWIVAFAYVAHLSVGLRLPERVLAGSEPRAPAVAGLTAFRAQLDRRELPEARIVSDPCLHFAVPYLVRRPTLPAFGERQVGFVDRLPLARKAALILEGGPRGRRLAERLHVGYAVADPECAPDLAARLGGDTVLANEELVVVRLPGSSGMGS